MSVYQTVDTSMTDMDMVKEALADMDIKSEWLEEHESGAALRGWNDDARARWVLRKEKAGSMYDIGFDLSDGKIRAMVEDMDYSDIAKRILNGELRQCYATRMATKVLEREFRRGGKVVKKRLKDGRIKLKMELGQ